MQLDVFHCGIGISAFAKAKLWQHSVQLLHVMPKLNPSPNSICYASAISACQKGEQWQLAMEVPPFLMPLKAMNLRVSGCQVLL